MARALVTGGAGFIGSHLVEHLLAAGHEVRVVDDFSTGRRENLAAVAGDARLTVIEGSVCDAALMAGAATEVDEVYHLAAAVGVRLVVAEPVKTLETNIRGAEVALAAAARAGARFFLASSSEVYGKSDRPRFDEDDDLLIGSTRFSRWGYACSKAVGEFLALAYGRERRVPVVIGRLFNTIGPRQVGEYGMVVPRFIEAALAGRPLEVYGTGQQTRTFIDVRDTAEAIVRLMATAAPAGPIYNIGSDREIPIDELADLVIALSGSRSRKRRLSYAAAYGEALDDMAHRVPAIGRARAVLGCQWPRHTLEAALQRTISEHRGGGDRQR